MSTFAPIQVASDPTPEQRGGALGTKHGQDLVVGDILFLLSSPHRITHFRDYSPSFVSNDEGWRIAYSGHDGDPHCWGMTIDPILNYWVA